MTAAVTLDMEQFFATATPFEVSALRIASIILELRRMVLTPWHILAAIAKKEDPLSIEALSILSKTLFVLWFTIGSPSPAIHMRMLQWAPSWFWIVAPVAMIGAHLISIRRRHSEARAYCLACSFTGWLMLSVMFARYGLTFVHVLSIPLAVFCFTAIVALVWRDAGRLG